MIQRPSINLNRSAIVLIVVVLALTGGGFALGYSMGTDHGKLVAAQNPPRQQSIAGTVKSADDKGMTVETPNGDWKIVYSDTTEFRSGLTLVNKKDFKKGDAIRAVGTTGGEEKGRTLNARSIIKTSGKASGTPDPKGKPGEKKEPVKNNVPSPEPKKETL